MVFPLSPSSKTLQRLSFRFRVCAAPGERSLAISDYGRTSQRGTESRLVEWGTHPTNTWRYHIVHHVQFSDSSKSQAPATTISVLYPIPPKHMPASHHRDPSESRFRGNLPSPFYTVSNTDLFACLRGPKEPLTRIRQVFAWTHSFSLLIVTPRAVRHLP